MDEMVVVPIGVLIAAKMVPADVFAECREIFYSGMLIWMNTRVLPDAIKLRGRRLVVMWITFLIFAVLTVYLVYYQIASNFFGLE